MTIPKSALLLALSCTIGLLSAQEGASDPTFNPMDTGLGVNGNARCVAVQPDGKILIAGLFTACNGVARSGIARLNADGSLDTGFNPGSGVAWVPSGNYALFEYGVMEMCLQPDGKILIAGEFSGYNGVARKNIARLNANGSLDTSFDPGTGPSSDIYALALQSDGHIFIGGVFSSYNGTARNYIARLNANGSLDTGSNLGTGAQGIVRCIAVHSDDKVVVGGEFSAFNGTAHNRIVRLSANGGVDAGFPGPGVNGDVQAMALQPDGKILIGGEFTTYNGAARPSLARVNTDGSLDTGFDPGTATSGIMILAVKPDGGIMLGGRFSSFNGVTRLGMAELQANGTVSAGFDPGQCIRGNFPNGIESIAFTAANRVIAGGGVAGLHGCPFLFNFLPNGSLDTSFLPLKGANGPIECHAVQADGKILIGGSFTLYNGVQRIGIARLNADGTLDGTFSPGTGVYSGTLTGTVYSLVVQPDGKIVIAGNMTTVNGIPVDKVTRLNADGSVDSGFNDNIPPWGFETFDLALLPDGKILTQGRSGQTTFLVRLEADGQIDNGFTYFAFESGIHTFTLQSDGKILVGGNMTINGSASRIARLNANGTLDTGFNPGTGANNSIEDIDIGPNGTILISGWFTTFNGVPCGRLARLLPDGTLDASFAPGSGADADIRTTVILSDGRIIAAGNFMTFNGTVRPNIVRLLATGSVDGSFNAGSGTSSVIGDVTPLSDGKLIATGWFNTYQGYGRNRIARINGTPRAGIKLMLEGPYSGTTMNDALRTLPSFPLTEPFTAMGYAEIGYVSGATIGSSVLSTTGNNAIVDWVIVEMRPVAAPGTVAASRAVLLQRDGDVVDLDGVSTVGFAGLAAGNYCVAVKPRNHLPVMLSATTPVSYGAANATVDFTLPTTLVSDNDARKNVSGVMVLAAGDVTFNETVGYTGAGNDRDPILTRVGSTTPNNSVSGYWREDVNMDGAVKYTGSANDRDIILTNVGSTTPNNTRVATLP